MVRRMSIVAAAMLLVASGSGPAGCWGAPAELRPLDARTPIGETIAEAGRQEDVRRLATLFAATPRQFPVRGLMGAVRIAFAQPFALPEVARAVTQPAAEGADRPYRAVARFAARAFGMECGLTGERSTLEVSTPQRAEFAMDFLLNESNLIVGKALAACLPAEGRDKVARAAINNAASSTGRRGQVPDALATAMKASADIDRDALVRAVAHFDTALDVQGDWKTFEAEALPPELAGAVDGTVLTTQRVDELGWIVIGGPGPNRYDMTKIAAVFDPAGDDRYEWGTGVVGSRLVVDVAGNDVHASSRGADGAPPLAGPAGAACGVCVIDDFAGNDRYECAQNGLGAATFGVGILVDRAGDDTYTGGAWTVGAAFAGIGAICDLGGSDLYVSEMFSQGCGGPGGAALLLDATGGDRYRADGTAPSAYETPTVHCSFSQGVGFGYRAGAAGGVGALVDLAGDDRYEGGEFAQGCGYFLSMGILRDSAGRDLYYGNRYAQGTAAHQSFGALLDGAGDDIYWSMTAAGQGAAWDVSVAVLVDGGGDDRYQADGLSQGAAAMQAIGFLSDRAGHDDYRAAGASQGSADGNGYHWDTTHCTSVGVLQDRDGPNRFNAGRADGDRRMTGDATSTTGQTQWGVFVTR
jgi:hypothetical protein